MGGGGDGSSGGGGGGGVGCMLLDNLQRSLVVDAAGEFSDVVVFCL